MFNKRHIVRTIAATVSILALSFTAACGSGQSTASNSADSDDITQQTYKPGKLTIATGQPAYEPWVMNDKPESGEGYEAAVAYAVADKLGFKKSDVVWTRTAFDTAIAPGAKDWDFNIQQFGITDERKKAVDFSSSYYNDSQSVVVKKDSKFANATKVSDLKDATVGVMVGTLAYDYAKANIKDDTSTVECVYMVQSEQVKDAKVLGRLPDSEDKSGMGIVLPKDSKLTAAVTKAVDDLNADGTIKKLQDKWLAEYTTDLTELKK